MRKVTRALCLLPFANLLFGASSAHAFYSDIPHQPIYVGTWECDANWDQDCEDAKVIEAAPGWQVCKVSYTETTRDGWDAWFRHEPTSFYTNDPEHGDRYRAVRLAIRASGTGNPLDQRGSKMRVDNIVVDTIPADLTNAYRYMEGCTIVAHD